MLQYNSAKFDYSNEKSSRPFIDTSCWVPFTPQGLRKAWTSFVNDADKLHMHCNNNEGSSSCPDPVFCIRNIGSILFVLLMSYCTFEMQR